MSRIRISIFLAVITAICKFSSAETVVNLNTCKNVFLDYKLQSFNMKKKEFKKFDEEALAKIKNQFVQGVEKLGFNIVDTKEGADVILKLLGVDVYRDFTGMFNASFLYVQFLDPKTGYILLEYNFISDMGNLNGQVDIVQKSVLKKIKKNMDENTKLAVIYDNGEIRKGNEHTYEVKAMAKGNVVQRVISNNNYALEGPVLGLDQIKIKGSPENTKKVALLVYKNQTAMTEFDLIDSYGLTMFKLDKFNDMDIELYTRYGYYISYYPANKKVNIYFESDPWRMIDDTYQYYFDVSDAMSNAITDFLVAKQYSVVNLTPARFLFANMKCKDILEQVSQSYGVDTLILVSQKAETKTVNKVFRISFEETSKKIGLYLDYLVFILKIDSEEPIAECQGHASAFMSDKANLNECEINFFQTKINKNSGVEKYEKGLFDDAWMVKNLLSNIDKYVPDSKDKKKNSRLNNIYDFLTEWEGDAKCTQPRNKHPVYVNDDEE